MIFPPTPIEQPIGDVASYAEIAEVFRRVLNALRMRHNYYICLAVYDATDDLDVIRLVQDIIRSRLNLSNTNDTALSWLLINVPQDVLDDLDLSQWRVEWVERLVDEFEQRAAKEIEQKLAQHNQRGTADINVPAINLTNARKALK